MEWLMSDEPGHIIGVKRGPYPGVRHACAGMLAYYEFTVGSPSLPEMPLSETPTVTALPPNPQNNAQHNNNTPLSLQTLPSRGILK